MIEEVYKTAVAQISQCDMSESFILNYELSEISFKLCDLIAFRRKINQINLVEMLHVESADAEIIYLPHCNRFLVLSIREVLEFRELLNGTFNILALNSAIQKTLRLSAYSNK